MNEMAFCAYFFNTAFPSIHFSDCGDPLELKPFVQMQHISVGLMSFFQKLNLINILLGIQWYLFSIWYFSDSKEINKYNIHAFHVLLIYIDSLIGIADL